MQAKFGGLTPLGTMLQHKILQPFVLGPAKARSLQKPVLVITITDGGAAMPFTLFQGPVLLCRPSVFFQAGNVPARRTKSQPFFRVLKYLFRVLVLRGRPLRVRV